MSKSEHWRFSTKQYLFTLSDSWPFYTKRQCPAGPKQTDNFGEGMITTCCCTVFVEEGMIATCCCTIFVEVYVIPITTHMILKIPWGTYARLPIQSCGSDPDIISEVPGKI